MYYILLAGCLCVSVDASTRPFRAYVREIFKLIVPDDLGYVSQLSNVLFLGRICLSKMTEGPVCDANAAATTNAEIKNTWITTPLPQFFAALGAIRQCDKLSFTSPFRRENACLEDSTN